MPKIIVEEANMRLDNYLIDKLDLSRNQIQVLIKNADILVNNEQVKNNYQVKINDVINVSENINKEVEILGEPIDINVVYEDNDVIVINKPKGMVVHPAAGNKSGTLVNALLNHTNQLSNINGDIRQGIVHRIDQDTTGLLLIAKNNDAHIHLAKQFEQKSTKRKYIALVWGVIPNDTGTIDAPIGRDSKDRKKMAVTASNSKKAITNFKVLERFEDATLIEVELETGRTHQIRVHMGYIGYPIVNDKVYSRRKLLDNTGQMLHAKTIGFIHPKTKEYMEFDSELPDTFISNLDKIKN